MLKYQIVKAENQKNIVILLHGYGSSAYDIIGITHLFTKLAPSTTFIAPFAPLPCSLGFGQAWFPISENPTTGRLEVTDLKSVAKANKILKEFIQYVSSTYHTDVNHIALFGFSQGGIMALFQGLHSRQQFASIVAHSTIFFDDPLTTFNKNQNILLIHGKQDEVLPFDMFEKTKKFLKAKHITFQEFTKIAMGHNVDNESLQVAEKFFFKHF